MSALAAVAIAGSLLGSYSAVSSGPDTAEPVRPAAERDPRRGKQRDRDPHGWLVPDFAKLQTGGFVGLLNVGVGYAVFDDVLNLGVHYGYTPERVAGRDVHTLHFRLDVRPFELRFGSFRWVPGYLGAGLLHVWGDQYFSDLPDRYAAIDGTYYPPTALHWTAHLGTELDWLPRFGFFERHGFYYELATIDTFAFAYLENSETVGLTDALSSTFGYRAAW